MQGASSASALNCGAVQPVWVNLKTRAYHEPNDPYYGKTSHGKYMCPSAARAAGYHAAGESAGNTGNSTSGAMSGSTKHHRHHGAKSMNSSESPTPEPMST